MYCTYKQARHTYILQVYTGKLTTVCIYPSHFYSLLTEFEASPGPGRLHQR